MNLKITTENRRVVKFEKVIIVNGVEFDAMDLYDTLHGLSEGDIYVTNRNMVTLLKKLKVIDFEGRKDIPATVGKNYRKFCAELEPHFDKLLWSE